MNGYVFIHRSHARELEGIVFVGFGFDVTPLASVFVGGADESFQAFDRLDPIEQHAVVVSLIRRTGELPTEPLTDDDLCGIAEDLFASLDDEENGNNNAEAR